MTLKYKFHPAIGGARVGNSSEFYLAQTAISAYEAPPAGLVT